MIVAGVLSREGTFTRWLQWIFPVAIANLSGCATITEGREQTVTVTTVCEGVIVTGVACELANNKGRWRVITPQSARIHKSYGGLSVTCQQQSATGATNAVSDYNDGAWGNVLLGGGVGYLLDTTTGAGFDYPNQLTVVLKPPCNNVEEE